MKSYNEDIDRNYCHIFVNFQIAIILCLKVIIDKPKIAGRPVLLKKQKQQHSSQAKTDTLTLEAFMLKQKPLISYVCYISYHVHLFSYQPFVQ